VECQGNVPAPYANLAAFLAAGGTASDDCDKALTLSVFSDTGLVGGTCGGTVTRVYRVTDDCGNYADCSQVITVRDTTKPSLNSKPANVSVECDAVPGAPTITATDNCDSDVTVTMNEVKTAGACAGSYTLKRTWTAEDDCGNKAYYTQTITVTDTKAPVVTWPGDVVLTCTACNFDPANTGTP